MNEERDIRNGEIGPCCRHSFTCNWPIETIRSREPDHENITGEIHNYLSTRLGNPGSDVIDDDSDDNSDEDAPIWNWMRRHLQFPQFQRVRDYHLEPDQLLYAQERRARQANLPLPGHAAQQPFAGHALPPVAGHPLPLPVAGHPLPIAGHPLHPPVAGHPLHPPVAGHVPPLLVAGHVPPLLVGVPEQVEPAGGAEAAVADIFAHLDEINIANIPIIQPDYEPDEEAGWAVNVHNENDDEAAEDGFGNDSEQESDADLEMEGSGPENDERGPAEENEVEAGDDDPHLMGAIGLGIRNRRNRVEHFQSRLHQRRLVSSSYDRRVYQNAPVNSSDDTSSDEEITCPVRRETSLEDFKVLTAHDILKCRDPLPRSGHRLVSTMKGIYLIGGYNPLYSQIGNINDKTAFPLFKEVWQFHPNFRRWSRVKYIGDMPTSLASHSVVSSGNYIILFGGTEFPFGNASNAVHIFHLKTNRWEKLVTDGSKPLPGYGHACWLHNEHLYVHGGTTGWRYNSLVYRLNLRERTWTQVATSGTEPMARYRHEVAYYNSKVFVFGGEHQTRQLSLSEVPVLNLQTNHWTVLCSGSAASHDGCNLYPGARKSHALIQSENYAYICGGMWSDPEDSQTSYLFDDIWRFNLEGGEWCRLHVNLPQPVHFHAACMSPDNRLVAFGGVTRLKTYRISDTYLLWVNVPSLLELGFDAFCHYFPLAAQLDRHTLLKIGIPQQLLPE